MKPRALSTLMVPNRFCMPTTGSAPRVTEILAGLAVDIERVVAGGEDVGRVVAGARVQGRRVEGRRGVHVERVAAAAAVDRERRQDRTDRSTWWRCRSRRRCPVARPSSLLSVQVWPVASFSSWKIEVGEAGWVRDRDRALDARHRAGAAGRADVDGGQGVAGDIDRLVVGDDVDRAAVIGAGGDVEHAEEAGVVDVDRIDAALAVDVGDDEVGGAVDADVVIAVGAERVLGVQGQRADVVVVGQAAERTAASDGRGGDGVVVVEVGATESSRVTTSCEARAAVDDHRAGQVVEAAGLARVAEIDEVLVGAAVDRGRGAGLGVVDVVGDARRAEGAAVDVEGRHAERRTRSGRPRGQPLQRERWDYPRDYRAWRSSESCRQCR